MSDVVFVWTAQDVAQIVMLALFLFILLVVAVTTYIDKLKNWWRHRSRPKTQKDVA